MFNIPMKTPTSAFCVRRCLGKSGFSLLETLVAIAILTGAVLGPLALASQSIRASSLSGNRATAFFLAQEAIEYIRSRRDANLLTARPWLDSLDGCVGGNGCAVDPFPQPDGSVFACSSDGCPFLQYGRGEVGEPLRYGYSLLFAPEESVFQRTAEILPLSGIDYEAKVKVTVEWNEHSNKERFIIEDYLFRF